MVTFGPFGKRAVFLDFLLAKYPRHFYSTLPEPECDTGKARDQNFLFIELIFQFWAIF